MLWECLLYLIHSLDQHGVLSNSRRAIARLDGTTIRDAATWKLAAVILVPLAVRKANISILPLTSLDVADARAVAPHGPWLTCVLCPRQRYSAAISRLENTLSSIEMESQHSVSYRWKPACQST